jgi:hypothetical protein
MSQHFLVFPLKDDGHDAEAADAGGEEAKKYIGRRNQPAVNGIKQF